MTDEELELTDEEMIKLLGIEYYCDDLPKFQEIAKAQHNKTLKIAEPVIRRDERERILEEADRLFAMLLCASSSTQYDEVRNLWQALKEKEKRNDHR